MRSMKKVFTKNSVLQIDQGNLRSRLVWLKLVICLKTPVLSKVTMDQGNLMSVTSQLHSVKEQHAHDVHREITSFNTNNEFKRAINEEDIDFNIPGVPHSTVKQLHGTSVRDMIQKIENCPNRHALHRDLQQKSIIQSLQPRIKTNDSWSWERRIVWTTRCWTHSTLQSMSIILGRRHRPLHVRALLAQRNGGNKKFVQSTMDLFSILNYYIKKGRPHGHRYGKNPGDYE